MTPSSKFGCIRHFKYDRNGIETVIPLKSRIFTIGSKVTCDIRLFRYGIELEHCQININNNGIATIQNKSTINPVKVNAQTVISEAILKPGDEFTICGKLFIYENDGISNKLVIDAEKKNLLSRPARERYSMYPTTSQTRSGRKRQSITPQPHRRSSKALTKNRRSNSQSGTEKQCEVFKTPRTRPSKSGSTTQNIDKSSLALQSKYSKSSKGFKVSTPNSECRPSRITATTEPRNLNESVLTPKIQDESVKEQDRAELVITPLDEFSGDDITTPDNNTSYISAKIDTSLDESVPLRSKKSKCKDISINRLTNNDDSITILNSPSAKTPKSALKSNSAGHKISTSGLKKSILLNEFCNVEEESQCDSVITLDSSIGSEYTVESVHEVSTTEGDGDDSQLFSKSSNVMPSRKSCVSFVEAEKHDNSVNLPSRRSSRVTDFHKITGSPLSEACETPEHMKFVIGEIDKSNSDMSPQSSNVNKTIDLEEDVITSTDSLPIEPKIVARRSSRNASAIKNRQSLFAMKSFNEDDFICNNEQGITFSESFDATNILKESPLPNIPEKNVSSVKSQKRYSKRLLSDEDKANQENLQLPDQFTDSTLQSVDTSSFIYISNNVSFENANFDSPGAGTPSKEASLVCEEETHETTTTPNKLNISGINEFTMSPSAEKETTSNGDFAVIAEDDKEKDEEVRRPLRKSSRKMSLPLETVKSEHSRRKTISNFECLKSEGLKDSVLDESNEVVETSASMRKSIGSSSIFDIEDQNIDQAEDKDESFDKLFSSAQKPMRTYGRSLVRCNKYKDARKNHRQTLAAIRCAHEPTNILNESNNKDLAESLANESLTKQSSLELLNNTTNLEHLDKQESILDESSSTEGKNDNFDLETDVDTEVSVFSESESFKFEEDLNNIEIQESKDKVNVTVSVEGRKLRTPKVQKEPTNDLTNPVGVKKMFRTPRNQKSPKNDLSNPIGVKQLLKTPAPLPKEPENDLSDPSGVKNIFMTPKVSKDPKDDLTNPIGVKQMFKTPKTRRSVKNDLTDPSGVKELLQTPLPSSKKPANDLSHANIPVEVTMNTPSASEDSTKENSVEAKQTFKTPMTRRSHKKNNLTSPSDSEEDLILSETPESKDDVATNSGGARKLRTPKIQKEPTNDLTNPIGVREMLKTPKTRRSVKNDLTDPSGVKELLQTPLPSSKKPANDLSHANIPVEVNTNTPNVAEDSIKDLSNSVKAHQTFKTPMTRRSYMNSLTDSSDCEEDLILSETPESKDSVNVATSSGGARKLRTPKIQKEPTNDLTNPVGVKKMFRTPKNQKSPKNDLSNPLGVKQLLKTPAPQPKGPENDLSDPSGVKNIFMTPKVSKDPKDDLTNPIGVRQMFKTPKTRRSVKNDLTDPSGVKELLQTPFQASKTPTVAEDPTNSTSNKAQQTFITPKTRRSPKDDLTDSSGMEQLVKQVEETPVRPPAELEHNLSTASLGKNSFDYSAKETTERIARSSNKGQMSAKKEVAKSTPKRAAKTEGSTDSITRPRTRRGAKETVSEDPIAKDSNSEVDSNEITEEKPITRRTRKNATPIEKETIKPKRSRRGVNEVVSEDVSEDVETDNSTKSAGKFNDPVSKEEKIEEPLATNEKTKKGKSSRGAKGNHVEETTDDNIVELPKRKTRRQIKESASDIASPNDKVSKKSDTQEEEQIVTETGRPIRSNRLKQLQNVPKKETPAKKTTKSKMDNEVKSPEKETPAKATKTKKDKVKSPEKDETPAKTTRSKKVNKVKSPEKETPVKATKSKKGNKLKSPETEKTPAKTTKSKKDSKVTSPEKETPVKATKSKKGKLKSPEKEETPAKRTKSKKDDKVKSPQIETPAKKSKSRKDNKLKSPEKEETPAKTVETETTVEPRKSKRTKKTKEPTDEVEKTETVKTRTRNIKRANDTEDKESQSSTNKRARKGKLEVPEEPEESKVTPAKKLETPKTRGRRNKVVDLPETEEPAPKRGGKLKSDKNSLDKVLTETPPKSNKKSQKQDLVESYEVISTGTKVTKVAVKNVRFQALDMSSEPKRRRLRGEYDLSDNLVLEAEPTVRKSSRLRK